MSSGSSLIILRAAAKTASSPVIVFTVGFAAFSNKNYIIFSEHSVLAR